MTTRVDREFGIGDPVEGEARPAEVADDLLNAQSGIHDPLPSRPGHDEGERHGIQVNAAKKPFRPDPLIEKDRDKQAERDREDQKQGREDHDVLDRGDPSRRRPQSYELIQANEIIDRHDPGRTERHPHRPGDENINGHEYEQKARRENQLRQMPGYPFFHRSGQAGCCSGRLLKDADGGQIMPAISSWATGGVAATLLGVVNSLHQQIDRLLRCHVDVHEELPNDIHEDSGKFWL